MRSGSVKGIVKEGVTGGIAASLISAILVLIFAVICRLTAPSDLVMQLINQVIKGVSIFVGVYLMIKTAQHGFLKGLVGGAVFFLVSLTVFLILGGEPSFGSILLDIAIALINGTLTGVLAVNKNRIGKP